MESKSQKPDLKQKCVENIQNLLKDKGVFFPFLLFSLKKQKMENDFVWKEIKTFIHVSRIGKWKLCMWKKERIDKQRHKRNALVSVKLVVQ